MPDGLQLEDLAQARPDSPRPCDDSGSVSLMYVRYSDIEYTLLMLVA